MKYFYFTYKTHGITDQMGRVRTARGYFPLVRILKDLGADSCPCIQFWAEISQKTFNNLSGVIKEFALTGKQISTISNQ